MDEPQRWLVLVYRVASEPSRLRATVWRRLKSLGAIYLQSSVAALPASAESERAMRTLRNEIVEEMGGMGLLLNASALVGASDIVASFNAARDDDYEEIIDRCQGFVAEIEKEFREEHFTYGELEENDEDLAKLKGWYLKVHARDVLGSAGAATAEKALAECEQALNGFAERVYQEESQRMGDHT